MHAADVSRPHEPVRDTAAAEAYQQRLTTLAGPVEAWLSGQPLVQVAAGGFSLQPYLRVSVTHTAIALDNLAMLRSWRTHHLASALAVDAASVQPIDERSVSSLGDVLHRVRHADDLRRRFALGGPWINVDVFVTTEVPWRRVYPVLQTLAAEQFTQYNLVARRGEALVVRPLNVPDSEPRAPTPILPLTVRVRPAGWEVLMGSASVGNDCRGPGVSHPLAFVGGHPDAAALSACMTTLRTQSIWHERLSIQRHIQIDLDPALPWRDVYTVMTAVQDATPGSRDLFTNPVLGMLQ